MKKLRTPEETKVLDTEFEKALAIGSDNEKDAIADTKKILAAEEKVEKEKQARELAMLSGNRKFIVTYNQLLAGLLIKKLREVIWPKGWGYQVAPTDVGVILEIQSPLRRYFRAGFKSTGMEKYDLNAIETYVMRAENTIERIAAEGLPNGHN